MSGWIVEVEHEAGTILFAVRTAKPYDAEDIVKAELNLPKDRLVVAARRVDDDMLDRMHLKEGEIRGPM